MCTFHTRNGMKPHRTCWWWTICVHALWDDTTTTMRFDPEKQAYVPNLWACSPPNTRYTHPTIRFSKSDFSSSSSIFLKFNEYHSVQRMNSIKPKRNRRKIGCSMFNLVNQLPEFFYYLCYHIELNE